MSLRGFLRGLDAAQRRAARDEQRRQRIAARAAKLQSKLNELQQAAAEVEEFEDRLRELTTIHQTIGEGMDWLEIGARPRPPAPQRLRPREEEAMRARDAFTPTFWQKLVGTDKKIRAELEQKTAAARNLDEAVYQDVLKLHHNQLERWEGLTRLARIIAEGDVTAYREAFEELSPLSEMEDAGCSFEVNFSDAKSAHVRLLVESERVVPREAKSLTKTGKLNSKPLPQGRFFELYQDYVCGCVLRTSRELFAFLPLRRVILNVDATLLDSATGHLREQTILSAGISRATLEHLNFSAVDPSDAMRLFPHRMGFKRSQGFHPIEPLAPSEYPILDQSDSIAANIPS